MSADYLIQRIKDEFPELSWNRYRYVDTGWDHEVIILDEHLVFRIPRGYQDELTNEIRFLNYLKSRVEIGIPVYKYVSKDECLAGYPFLYGEELSAKGLSACRFQTGRLLLSSWPDFSLTPHNPSRRSEWVQYPNNWTT